MKKDCCPDMSPYPNPINIGSPMLAHAYVPYQTFSNIYPPCQGLQAGTIFPELDRPYGVDIEYTLDA